MKANVHFKQTKCPGSKLRKKEEIHKNNSSKIIFNQIQLNRHTCKVTQRCPDSNKPEERH